MDYFCLMRLIEWKNLTIVQDMKGCIGFIPVFASKDEAEANNEDDYYSVVCMRIRDAE